MRQRGRLRKDRRKQREKDKGEKKDDKWGRNEEGMRMSIKRNELKITEKD